MDHVKATRDTEFFAMSLTSKLVYIGRDNVQVDYLDFRNCIIKFLSENNVNIFVNGVHCSLVNLRFC